MNDPILGPLTDWMQNGATLESVGAIAGIATLIRFFLLPFVEAVVNRLAGVQFYSTQKLQVVTVVGIATTIAIGWATKTTTPINQQIMIGVLSAATAIGIHQATSQAKKAGDALNEKNQIELALEEARSVTPLTPARPQD
jgi:hypothetical protein